MDDELMIKQFLAAEDKPIDDDGFSERVMEHIPSMRPLWMSLLIAFVVVALAAFFFIRFDGWALVCNLLVDVISRIASIRYTSVNPLAFVALLGLVVWLWADKAKTIANETIS